MQIQDDVILTHKDGMLALNVARLTLVGLYQFVKVIITYKEANKNMK